MIIIAEFRSEFNTESRLFSDNIVNFLIIAKTVRIQKPHWIRGCLIYIYNIYNSALQIHAAILLPPFLPLATIYGVSFSERINSLD